MIQPRLVGWITAAAMLFSVFAAGVLGGLAVDELRSPPQAELRGRGSDGPGFGRGGPRVGGGRGGPDRGGPGRGMGMPGRVPVFPPGLLEGLSLSQEQRASVARILERRNAETEALLQGMYPRLRAQVDSANLEIRALLTPEQQAEFDRLREMRPAPGAGPRAGGPGTRPPQD